MHYLSKTQSRFTYLPWLQKLVDYGESVEVRGHKTLELLNTVTEITEPQHHCILLPSRRWNPFLALSEALWILAGRDDVAALVPYNQHIVDYSDDGVSLYGAYGKRIYDQIDPIIERLKKDPNDRRAVLQIWDNAGPTYSNNPWHEDLWTHSKDPPCNTQVMFKLRQNKLHMTVINRSNDLHFGLFAVNLPTFGILQSYIAARLGVNMGIQTHFSNSLHIYTDEPRAAAITDRMLYQETENMPVYPKHKLAFTDITQFVGGHNNFASWCSAALDNGGDIPVFLQFLVFARYFLEQYRKHEWHPDDLPFKDEYFDWIIAADLFLSKVWDKSYAI